MTLMIALVSDAFAWTHGRHEQRGAHALEPSVARAASAWALSAADRCGLPFVAAVLAEPPDRVMARAERDRPRIQAGAAIRVPVGEQLGANSWWRPFPWGTSGRAGGAARSDAAVDRPSPPFEAALSTSPPDPEARSWSDGERIQSLIVDRMPLCEEFGAKDAQ
jgi:hypothetical protein